jgi:hypothetical protein
MKKQSLVKPLLLLSFLVATLAVAFANINMTDGLRAALGSNPQGARAPDTRTLKEKAKVNGRFVRTEEPSALPPSQSVEEISHLSSAVIIGTTESNACRLSADGKQITIDYQVKVQEVLKGGIAQGQTITVSLPGGRVSFDDGTTAEIKTPWFRKMENGKTYILFLSDGEKGVFVTTGGPQGVYGTSETDGTIKTHSGRLRDPAWKYNGMDKRKFLDAVRKSVSNVSST